MHRLGCTRKPQHQNGGFLVLRSSGSFAPKKKVNPNISKHDKKHTNWRQKPRKLWLASCDTLLETNISPEKSILKMIFLFPRWDMLIPWRVMPSISCQLSILPSLGPGLGPGILDPYPAPSWRSIAQCQVVKIGQCNFGEVKATTFEGGSFFL